MLPDDAVTAEARVMAQRAASLAPGGARLNNQTFKALALALAGHAQPASVLIADSYRRAASSEHREGVSAFVEKRAPQFDLLRKP